MTEDRMMVAKAVFEGKISEDHLTMAEVDEFMLRVADVAMMKEMVAAEQRGLNVFVGYEDSMVH